MSTTIEKIQRQIAENPILLYMKGSPKLPSCGFSAQAVQALSACGERFAYVDILQNPDIRAELPKYANWPTFPQLWVDGELVGGCDILIEMYQRGELHLTILLETMRREGYELAVGRPKVIFKTIDGEQCEPYEMLTLDVEESHQGGVMEALGYRKGDLQDMVSDGRGRVRLEYRIPARGLIGFQGECMNLTRGTGLMSHVFDEYAPVKGDMPGRRNGVLISAEQGEAVAYALWKLQDRGRMFSVPGDRLYEGMVIGIHSRENDLVVNPIKGKQLTNIRSSGTDEAVRLVPPVALSLESAVEFIDDDELVEITPKNIRIRKRFLTEHERRRAMRAEG